MKKALVTGIHGQDGSYLSEYLLGLGYSVFGLSRRLFPVHDAFNAKPEVVVKKGINYIFGDMRDELSIETAIRKSWPDEIYNLAGQVYVPVSWEHPEETLNVNTAGLERILKIISRIKPDTRVYQASSSEMFGNVNGTCNEETPLNPMSPYGVSKAAAHRLCALYRERGLFVVSGMLFNHESPRRGYEMVTRKIARHVAQMAVDRNGKPEPLKLGNIKSRRDWGYAKDYVEAMHMMLQQGQPEDFVIGTGESHSIMEFLIEACNYAEVLVPDVVQDPTLTRTNEIWDLRADASKAKEKLGWESATPFWSLVRLMVMKELEVVHGETVEAT